VSGVGAAPQRRFNFVAKMVAKAARASTSRSARQMPRASFAGLQGERQGRHWKTRKFLMPIAVACSRAADVMDRSDSVIQQVDLTSILACSRNDNG